jgi:hypothetical protein
MESNKADAIVRQPFELRTMFFEMHLLNDASQMHATSFIPNRKEWGEGKRERERTGKELEAWSVAEKGLWRGS